MFEKVDVARHEIYRGAIFSVVFPFDLNQSDIESIDTKAREWKLSGSADKSHHSSSQIGEIPQFIP